MKKQKKLKIIILCLIIAIIAIGTTVIVISLNNKNGDEQNNTSLENTDLDNNESTNESDFIEIANNKPSKTTTPNIFFTVDSCIKNYLMMLHTKTSDVVLSYLNSDFINEDQINENNIFQKLEQYNNINSYMTVDMYNYIGNGAISYYTKGIIDNRNVYFILALDQTNGTFDIIPITGEKYNNILNGDLSDEVNNDRMISGKEYNFYSMLDFDDQGLAKKYYQEFITLMLASTDETYNFLDEQYRNLRFPTINNFNQYINNNKEKFQTIYKVTSDDGRDEFNSLSDYLQFITENSSAQLTNYAVVDNGESKQYVCLDGYNNYYIFNVKSPGDFTVYLDNHIIDTNSFIEKYDKSSEENKCALNAEKIKDAINTQDYSYIYSKLDNRFKSNKFPSEDNLRLYLQSQLFNATEFEYSKVKKNSEIYEINLIAKDKTGKNTVQKNVTIIMKLLDNRDYTMSFSIEE